MERAMGRAMSQRKIVYGEEARSHALGLWAEGHINANGQRPWREDYLTAVRQVLPALRRYTTVDELVVAYYPAALHSDLERACPLTAGPTPHHATVDDRSFCER